MSDGGEPSYYEIALTNRQVLVSFVVLLGCVLVAFAMGVWVGRMDPAPEVAASAPAPEPETENGELAALEEFQFPSDEAEDELRKPDLSELRGETGGPARQRPGGAPERQTAAPPTAAGGSTETTLAQEVGSDPRPAPPPSATPRPAAPPPPRQRTPPPPAPPKAAPPPPVAAEEPAEGFIIQVFSTRDEPQAKKVVARLQKGGHKAFLSPVQVGSQTMYRVRIGPFARRAPAEKAAAEITRDYKLETWITAASN